MEKLITVNIRLMLISRQEKLMVGIGSQVLGARPQSWLMCQARHPGPGEHKNCPTPGTVVQGGYLVRRVESEPPEVL